MTSHRHLPTQPMAADMALPGAVLFQFDSTSADGEPTRMIVQLGDPVVRTAWEQALTDPYAREKAWAANPECVECGAMIDTPRKAGVFATKDGHRVACKTPCAIARFARMCPVISTGATLRRTGGR